MSNSSTAQSTDFPEESDLALAGQGSSNRSLWIFGGVVALAATLLFVVLEARRADVVTDASVPVSNASGELISAPPALAVPAMDSDETDSLSLANDPKQLSGLRPVMLQPVKNSTSAASFSPRPVIPQNRGPLYYDPNSPDPPYIPSSANQRSQSPTTPASTSAPDLPNIGSGGSDAVLAGNRVGATRFSNPSATVPQGAVIQAVLETALDSNRPGFVRAIVSRDVRSFDGTRVLIERGSRLFGEYKAELASGQNRAFIQWLTLTRPDGVQIAVNSPAADPLGRAGVKGDVNTHFFQRFAGALLQSTLDLGVGLLTRNNGTVVVGLPGSTAIVNSANNDLKPTLKVKHGASVSVFVARDLDFTAVL